MWPVLARKLVEGHQPFPIVAQPLHCLGGQLAIAGGELRSQSLTGGLRLGKGMAQSRERASAWCFLGIASSTLVRRRVGQWRRVGRSRLSVARLFRLPGASLASPWTG